ncbi:hypothetical protein SUGI_0944050, partial [Cryptomeria japonica]
VLEFFAAGQELRSTQSAAKFNYRLRPVKCSGLVTDKVNSSRPSDAEYVPSNSSMDLVTAAVNAIFSYKPFYNFASKKAREMIIKRGTDIGQPWEAELTQLRLHDWESELKAVQNQDIVYPEYYLKPFHAYEEGNLSWQAALEVELAAKSVHANVFDPQRKKLDPEGDSKLRSGYHEKICAMIKATPKSIVDFGCATGLSTFGLHQVFPGADIVGVDLSPYFLSVGNFCLKEKSNDGYLPIQFLHAMIEDTALPSHSFDLVSLSSVCHELPSSVTEQVIDEANRLLKSGGALCIMEMNPHSPLVQKMVNNVFAFTAFKATEPYFDDYRTFSIEKAIEERGFTFPFQADNSPRHRTIVAHKR